MDLIFLVNLTGSDCLVEMGCERLDKNKMLGRHLFMPSQRLRVQIGFLISRFSHYLLITAFFSYPKTLRQRFFFYLQFLRLSELSLYAFFPFFYYISRLFPSCFLYFFLSRLSKYSSFFLLSNGPIGTIVSTISFRHFI